MFNYELLQKFGFSILIITILLLLFAFLLKWLQKLKVTTGNKTDDLQILNTRYIDSKNKLLLIRWHNMQYLVFCSANNAMTIIDKKEYSKPSHEK